VKRWVVAGPSRIRTAPSSRLCNTSLRGSPLEITLPVPFLKPSAFLVQGVTTFPTVKALHPLGTLQSQALDKVLGGLLHWLGHLREQA